MSVESKKPREACCSKLKVGEILPFPSVTKCEATRLSALFGLHHFKTLDFTTNAL